MKTKLREKYGVVKLDTKESLPNSVDVSHPLAPLVLIPGKDPAAFIAAAEYSRWCEPELGKEIREWLRSIQEEGMVLGTQGLRNLPYAIVADLREEEIGL